METMMTRAAEGFSLGQFETATPVKGGLSNDMWRVTTSDGDFAVKVMRAHADTLDFRDNVEMAFAIEVKAFRAGTPCPEPMPSAAGHALLRVEGNWLRAHRWCEGSTPSPGNCLEGAGSLLAKIHQTSGHSVLTLDDRPRGVETWTAFAEQPGLPAHLGHQLRSAAPTLAHLEAATAAKPHLATTYADSHGDLDPKNTLMTPGRLMAVDWDAAGPRPIAREAITLALDWAESIEDFRRVLSAYASSSGTTLPTEPWVFGGWVEALSGWLVYNVEHRADTDLGLDEAAEACARLLALHDTLDKHMSALNTI